MGRQNYAKSTANGEIIPENILYQEIFTRLPVESLIRFKSRSRHWNMLISSPDFAKLHYQRQLLSATPNLLIQNLDTDPTLFTLKVNEENKDAKTMKESNFALSVFDKSRKPRIDYFCGSCNGLIGYLKIWYEEIFCIWNPATRQTREIKSPYNDSCMSTFINYSGFGYCSSSNDYKIVFIWTKNWPAELRQHIYGYLYTSSSNEWKPLQVRLSADELKINWRVRRYTSGIQVGEALYWLLGCVNPDRTLLVFDLANECFSLMRIPNPVDTDLNLANMKCENLFLCEIRQSLCACWVWRVDKMSMKSFVDTGMMTLDVWMLEQNGVSKSWKRYFCFPNLDKHTNLDLYHFKNCILFELPDQRSRVYLLIDFMSFKNIICVDPNRDGHNSVTEVEIGNGSVLVCTLSYTESLIWPFYQHRRQRTLPTRIQPTRAAKRRYVTK